MRSASSVKYLGHVISNNLSDDLDIERQRRQLYAQGNTILRKFHMCSIQVKLTLFHTYCSPIYTAQLWWSYKKSSMSKLLVSYHNIFKLFIGVSKFESTSTLCMVTDTLCCQAVIRNLVYRFMQRLESAPNVIVKALLATISVKYKSRIRLFWNKLLYVRFLQ